MVQNWTSTAEYLSRAIPAYSFEIVPLDFTQVRQAVKDQAIDFLITNSSYYVALEYEFGASRIATIKNLLDHVPKTLYGGVIFTRSNRKDINGLHDLAGKSFYAVNQDSFGGWLMALREFHAQGITPGRDFKPLRFAGTHDAVVQAVLSGEADAGTVRTDTLEKMAKEGRINLASLKILNPQNHKDNFPYLHSTRLYPEWPFAKLRHTADKLSEDVAIALLSMPPTSPAAQPHHIGGWTVPLDYRPVHELLQELELGPYAYHFGKIRFSEIVEQHWQELLALLTFLASLLVVITYTFRLNRKLVAAEEEVSQYSQNLEELVEERTVELKKSESSLSEAQRLAQLGNWEWLIPENQVLWSDEAYRIYGYEPGEISPTYEAFIAAVHPADRELVKRTVDDALQKRGSYSVEHRLLLADGTERQVHEHGEVFWGGDGKPVRMVGIVQDITERVSLEQEQRRLAKAVEYAAESIVVTDREGTIQYVNPAFTTVTGYGQEEVLGKNARILQSGQHDQAFYAEMWDVLSRGESWSGHFVNRKKDGTFFEEEATISPILDGAGNIVNYVAVKHDISERLELEKRLRQAQKMEAIGTLAGGIAHDFNNILSIILGYAEMAKNNAPPDSTMIEDLEKVIEAGNRATDLVKQILAFSRQEAVERFPLQLQSLIKEALKMLRSSIPTTIEIQDDIDSRCGVVRADPTQVHQILMNLCTNASQAMAESGGILKVELKSVCIDQGDQQAALNLEPGEYVKLIVSDTGSGIGPDVLNKIFDPYFTTKGIGKGTGMGLAIVHGIITDYGGSITAESELGKGATFNVYFPVVDQNGLSPEENDKEIPSGKGRVLYVDDEELLTQMGKEMLERLGYTVTVHQSSLEALATFQDSPEDFDVIITDQTMPDLTGSDLARLALKIRPDIPIILCTGYSNLIDEDTAKNLGIKEFAMKPLTKGVLARLLHKVLNAS